MTVDVRNDRTEAVLDLVDREEARLEDEGWCPKCPYPMAAHPQIHGPAMTVDVCPDETMVREWFGR